MPRRSVEVCDAVAVRQRRRRRRGALVGARVAADEIRLRRRRPLHRPVGDRPITEHRLVVGRGRARSSTTHPRCPRGARGSAARPPAPPDLGLLRPRPSCRRRLSRRRHPSRRPDARRGHHCEPPPPWPVAPPLPDDTTRRRAGPRAWQPSAKRPARTRRGAWFILASPLHRTPPLNICANQDEGPAVAGGGVAGAAAGLGAAVCISATRKRRSENIRRIASA